MFYLKVNKIEFILEEKKTKIIYKIDRYLLSGLHVR
jgi:hypothetical protein